jgi:tRNA-2-methylthio-N6-dimethylallyladenosine synthase
MNEYDSTRIIDLVKLIGYEKTSNQIDADCCILNTCHIRNKATEKVYSEIGRIKKNFRNTKKPLVIVAGCVAQAESEEMLERDPYIDMVIGPQSYHEINDKILNYFRENKKINLTEFNVTKKFDKLEKIKNNNSKISNFLTIQEGCDKFCNFCVVPYTRGPEYSRPFDQIINEAKNLVENGSKEIILLGQNVNAYHFISDGKEYKLSNLLLELEKIKDLVRVRFTTSHSKDMTKDLIDCFNNCSKLMPFLHLPAQSGSDKILKLMNRKHDIKFYYSIIEKLKKINSDIDFSSDFIIGYPEEDDEDFEKTMNLVKKIEFTNSYSFIFSARPGTPAAKLQKINSDVTKNRLKIIQNQLFNLQLNKNKELEEKKIEILVENKLKNQNSFFGRTRKMTPVIFESTSCNPGDLIQVEIISSNQNNLFGKHMENKFKAA